MDYSDKFALVTTFDQADLQSMCFSSHPNFPFPGLGKAYLDASQAAYFYGDKQLSSEEALSWVKRDTRRAFWVRFDGVGEEVEAEGALSAFVHVDASKLAMLDRQIFPDSPILEEMYPDRPAIDFDDPEVVAELIRETMKRELLFGITASVRADAVLTTVEVMDHHFHSRELLTLIQDELMQGMPWSLDRATQLATLELPHEVRVPIANELRNLGKISNRVTNNWARRWRTPIDVVDEVDWHINVR
ncbi:MAG: hypothetical protein HY420_04215 [Candidatus Kerfeldbacteria bacterium]|nr:hypothetical protein [Candidatus Kerfeldbacteria bacterium]